MIKVLFICMGNICRSPTAEGVFRKHLQQHNLESRVQVDSAGTHGYHVGESPDPRTLRAAAERGYDLSELRARKVAPDDMEYFDLILAMDRRNLEGLRTICLPERQHRIKLFMHYARNFDEDEVPDPYYGLGYGFDVVLDMVEDASLGLIESLKRELGCEAHGGASKGSSKTAERA